MSGPLVGMASIFWLAPLLPLATFVMLASGLARAGRLAAWFATAAVAGSVVVAALGLVATSQGIRETAAVPWLNAGGRQFALALLLDPLSALVALLVYASWYMAGNPRLGRFFGELSLFLGAMVRC